MLSRFLFFLFIFLATRSVHGQTDDRLRQQVLEKGIVDSQFIYRGWTPEGHTKTRLKYLGQVVTKTGRTFRIMNYTLLWGLSPRATSRILVFNEKNQYLGGYYVTLISSLPDRLENGRLIFTNQDDPDCDATLVTKVNLTSVLPKSIFIRCKGNSGDIYTFSQ